MKRAAFNELIENKGKSRLHSEPDGVHTLKMTLLLDRRKEVVYTLPAQRVCRGKHAVLRRMGATKAS